MAKQMKHMNKRNKWFIAFWTLVSFLVLIFVAVFVLIYTTPNKIEKGYTTSLNPNQKLMTIKMTKKELNNMAAYYLKKVIKTDDVTLKVDEDDNNIVLYKKQEVFGKDVMLGVILKPKITKTGNLELYAEKMAAGTMPLPTSAVLAMLNKTDKLPESIQIIPQKKLIYIDMNDLKANGMSFQVEQLDLKNDKIVVEVGTK